ncbi:Two-component sensor histidine kinase, contains HisKA and HATPase domains [Rhizobium sp. RU35A]|uniref:HWE histidine kinase domain-containing protein n=1 Tax=Rhizobium sp. RU35A TaxID=1907414 RepID=UPI0009562920|nr:HWE histidine kinase domain-containing protein [Rhizobium sp. RU35A]SIQ03490.1 Two-component sensor histidine kinase, contains HisKA and HATPase domains [Rhizobium sp. RU35A]
MSNTREGRPGKASAAARSAAALNRLAARDNRLVQLLSRLPAFRSTTQSMTVQERLFAYAMSLVIEAVAVALRFVVDDFLPPGFPYLTFFPAVILTGFCFGIYPALMNTLISALVAWYWFIGPPGSFALSVQSMTALCFFFLVIAIDLGLLQLLLAAYASQVRARNDLAYNLQLQQLVSEEVDHRMKNLLATTSGLIALSQRHATTPAQLGSQLRQRIQAMGHSITLLRGSLHGGSADMREALLATLSPLGLSEGERLVFEGPHLSLNGTTIIALSLIIHELGTNALKYGALSQEAGQIAVSWRRYMPDDPEDGDEGERIDLFWRESNGPTVSAPSRQGFGTDLVTRMSSGLGGECTFAYEPTGLVVHFSMRASSVLA